jgi:hypothetical protein
MRKCLNEEGAVTLNIELKKRHGDWNLAVGRRAVAGPEKVGRRLLQRDDQPCKSGIT